VAPRSISNETFFSVYRPRRRDGSPLSAAWVEKYLGISERSLDLDPETLHKRSREEGGLYDSDYAIEACRQALTRAAVEPAAVDVLVHLTHTPDYPFLGEHFRAITHALRLRPDVHLVHHNLGCAGLAPSLRTARSELTALGPGSTALLVASQCYSSFISRDQHESYLEHSHPWAWLTPLIAGDGAGALVLGNRPDAPGRGFVYLWSDSDPSRVLGSYAGGGAALPTRHQTLREHAFVLNAPVIKENFVGELSRALEQLQRDWPEHLQPIVGFGFEPRRVKRWYLHQANRRLIEAATRALGLPPQDVPTNVERYGNTSSVSTLLLLEEDLRSGALGPGDLAVFLWIGAGNGTQVGCGVLVA
jgi:3-oxoacyl-[acyl-carrier-protein] synthase III